MRSLHAVGLLLLLSAGCDQPPSARAELARFCDVATAVRGERPTMRPTLLMQRFGETSSEEMRSYLDRLGAVPPDEKWAFTFRFASEHGESDWRCPALEEIFDEAAAPSD